MKNKPIETAESGSGGRSSSRDGRDSSISNYSTTNAFKSRLDMMLLGHSGIHVSFSGSVKLEVSDV